jgi:site-specific DNA-methyltransferase (adenine-specific)
MLSDFHNPDILTCLANLSSDEVFTPPNIANEMLDSLPVEIWSNKNMTFLDPVSKSGVFLREITKRLLKGLENEIPNIEERLQHILKYQVFGIGITKLTSEISRRTLYCSKKANGEYSIVDFNDDEGNLRYFEREHIWADGEKCKYCGVNRKLYQRDKRLESYAYSFIHENKPSELFNMKFDVIIGNPPYQMNDGGGMGTSAKPIYDKFVETAKKLQPSYLCMIIPSRWFSGGKGLDSFRKSMLEDKRISNLVDFFDSSECFPGVDISGGVCYFLWKKNHDGRCEITNIQGSKRTTLNRDLLEKNSSTFIRFNDAVSIIKKVKEKNEKSFQKIVSFRNPFKIDAKTPLSEKQTKTANLKIYAYPDDGWISEGRLGNKPDVYKKYKVFISKAYGERGNFPYLVIAKPFIGKPNEVSSETYLSIGPLESEKEAQNVISYMNTRFFRFLVLQKKNTQNAPQSVFEFVPMQDFNEEWSDEKIYKKYSISSKEIEYIESLVRPRD